VDPRVTELLRLFQKFKQKLRKVALRLPLISLVLAPLGRISERSSMLTSNVGLNA
jgi:hypothetical protein